jgi:hypothetical protein
MMQVCAHLVAVMKISYLKLLLSSVVIGLCCASCDVIVSPDGTRRYSARPDLILPVIDSVK